MRRIFIIIVDLEHSTPDLFTRIDQLGETYRHLGNIVFLSTQDATLTNAQSVFDRIHDGNSVYPSVSIFVLSDNDYAYWGYASRDLWAWIRSHRTA